MDGLPKKNETFFFFRIQSDRVRNFCQRLPQLAAEISHTLHTAAARDNINAAKNDAGSDGSIIPTVGANIAFSFHGLQTVCLVPHR